MPKLLQDLIDSGQEFIASMSAFERGVAAVLAVVLVIAVVQQLVKTAAVVVVLMAVGLIVVHGQSQHWSF